MMHWFQALLPRNEKFFDMFTAHSHTVVAGARDLRALLDGGDAVPRYTRAVMDQEHAADAVTRDILTAVGRSFITPIDRGAIKGLITAMDDSIDQMELTAKAANVFDIRTFTPGMRAMGDDIVQCALRLEEALPLLHSISREADRITTLTTEIQDIENHGDDLYISGVKELFDEHRNDPMGFFTSFRIYEHLEKTIDRFEDVANELQEVVIEHV